MQLVYGIDICQDVTQISTIRQAGKEPEELFFDLNTQEKLLPTVLYLGQSGKWFVCEEACAQAELEQGQVLKDFFHTALEQEKITYGETVYSSAFLLQCYIAGIVKRLEVMARGTKPDRVCITCEEINEQEEAKRRLQEVLKAAELDSFCEIQSHLASFVSYMIHQGEALWKNGAVAFEYGTDGISFYHINTCINSDKRQLIADYEKKKDPLWQGMPPKDPEEAKKAAFSFGNLAGLLLNRRQAVSLYITGRGFEGDFAMEQIQTVASNRRLFKGQNLYTQGACYIAYERTKGKMALLPEIYMPNQTVASISLKTEQNGHEEWIALTKAGDEYREIRKVFDVMIKGEPEFSLSIQRIGMEPYHIMLGLPVKRAEKEPNRYQLRLFFLHRDKCVLQIKDMGFGAFHPTTYRIYEKILDLSKLERKKTVWEA